MTDTRIKINFVEGTIELEGSEEFVEKHWEELKSYVPKDIGTSVKRTTSGSSKNGGKKTGPKGSKEHKPISYAPIPLNLKGDEKSPSLKKFFEEKLPSGNQEIITTFAYYLTKYCDVKSVEMGHLVSCYNEVGERKPSNIYQICLNTKNRLGYLATGDEPYSVKINIQGENLVEHDLPHKIKK